MKIWIEPEWWYKTQLLPTTDLIDYWTWFKLPWDVNILPTKYEEQLSWVDLSLLWTESIDYGKKLYDDIILRIITQMASDNPDYAFNPKDRWGRVFEWWFSTAELDWLRALEVWTWSAINVLKVLNKFKVIEIVWSDLEPDVVSLALKNVKKYCLEQSHKFTAVESNLLNQIDPDFLEKVDYIMWCIPQAILPKWAKKSPDDSAHYYPWEYFTQYEFNKLALGLNEALLHQISQVSRQAKVLLNLAWRVWKDNLIKLFETHWFNPEVKYEEIIPQCPSTSLDFFVKLEEDWFNGCELYSDPNWNPKKRITAKEAERIRVNEVKQYEGNVGNLEDIGVYHILQAIEGSL